jgi:hypothetical protein
VDPVDPDPDSDPDPQHWRKGCFIVHLFENATICASNVGECICSRIHRYVAAPPQKKNNIQYMYFQRASDGQIAYLTAILA